MADKIWWRNCYMCSCGIASIEDRVEPELRRIGTLGSTENIRIYQGCWNAGGVSASAGTHDGGGAIDTDRYDSDKELTVIREAGWAAWGRGNDKYGDGMDPHNHWICNGCNDLSSGAEDQVDDYNAGRNGLANNGKDPGPDVRPLPTWDDALADYDQGVFGMTKPVAFDNAKEQTFTGDGTWKTIKIDDNGDYSFLVGPKDAYIVTSHWTLEAIPGDPASVQPGDIVQFRYQSVSDFSDDRDTITEWGYPITDTRIGDGTTFDGLTWLNALGNSPEAGAKLKLRLFINPPDGKKVKLTKLTSRILY
jgi:hypothetical protein